MIQTADPTQAVQQPKIPDAAVPPVAKVAPLPLSGTGGTDPNAPGGGSPVPSTATTQPVTGQAQAPATDPYAYTPITDASGTNTTSPTAAPLAVPHPNDVTPATVGAGTVPPVGGGGAAPVTTDPGSIANTAPSTPYGTPAGPAQYNANGDLQESVWNPVSQTFAYKGTPEATAGPTAQQIAESQASMQGIINDPTTSPDIKAWEQQRLSQLGTNPASLYGDQSGNSGSWQANNTSPAGGVAPQTDGGVLADQMAQSNRWLGSAQTDQAQRAAGDPANFALNNGTAGAYSAPYQSLVGGQTFMDPTKALSADQALAQSGGLPTAGTPFGAAPSPTNQLPVQGADLSKVGLPPGADPALIANGAKLGANSGPTGTGGLTGGNTLAPTSQLGAAIGSGSTASASPNAGVGLTPTDPNNALTSQTITPNNSVDRVKLEQDALNSTIKNVLDPAYQARQTELNRTNFGAGRGVSGQARTSQGNLSSDYGNQIANLTNQGMTAATTGSIQDMYNNLGIAQQQQGFQAGQQQNAFSDAATQAALQDSLVNSAFGRSLQQEQAGYANDPSNIALILSQIFGGQANNAGQSAAGAFNQAGQNSVTDPTAAIKAYLKSLGVG